MVASPEKFAVIVNVLLKDGHVSGVASFPRAEESVSAIAYWRAECGGVEFVKGEAEHDAAAQVAA